MTTGVDTIVGTDKNDLITGTTAQLSVDDRIMDTSTTDNDTFNLTATADPVPMDVTNIENINIKWDAFGTPDIDLDNVIGATVTLSSEKSGYLGHANFTNVDRNNVTLGDGVVGTATVAGTVDSTINAGNAKTLIITGADRDLTVNANNSETVTIADTYAAATGNDVDNLTVSATNATALTVDANRSADVTVGKNADLTMTGTADYTIRSTADVQLDVALGAAFDTLAIAGDNAVTLSFENAADIDGQTITNAGVIRLEDGLVQGATVDYTEIEASNIVLEVAHATPGAAPATPTVITTVNGANFTVEKDLGYDTTFAVKKADDTDADEITVTLEAKQGAAVNLDFNKAGDEDFEIVNIIANAEVDATAADLEIASILAGENKVVLQSAVNDVEVTAITAGEVDASEVTGNFVIAQNNTDTDMLIIGGKAKNTVAFTGAQTKESTFVGNATSNAIDNITFDTTNGDAVAMVYGGNNIVTAAAIIDGQLTVVAGSGNDTVTATGTSLNDGTLSLQLGDGNNSVTFDMDAGRTGATVSITTGTGNDSIEITADTKAGDDITIDLGTGTNTLTISSVDLSLGTQSIKGVDVIAIGDSDTAAVVNATLLDGSSIKLTGDSTPTDHLAVAITGTDTTVDFSGMTIDNTLDKAIGGLEITAKAGFANNITATHGDDIINVNVGVDTINFAATAELNGTDNITGFTANEDKINLDALTTETVLTGNLTTATATTAITIAQGNVFLVTGAAGAADDATAGTAAAAAAAINAAAAWTDAEAGVKAYFVIADDNTSAIYEYTYSNATPEIQGAELTLMGTVNVALTATDIVFA